jgi:hypothetical protein
VHHRYRPSTAVELAEIQHAVLAQSSTQSHPACLYARNACAVQSPADIDLDEPHGDIGPRRIADDQIVQPLRARPDARDRVAALHAPRREFARNERVGDRLAREPEGAGRQREDDRDASADALRAAQPA